MPKSPIWLILVILKVPNQELRKRGSRRMSTRTSRKRSAAAAAIAETEETAEASEQDDVTDGEPDGADDGGWLRLSSEVARRLMTMMAQCRVSQSSGASGGLIRRVRLDALHPEAGLHRAAV